MSIDWVTVLAQLANFLLLVWLLKKFLYRPILDGIAAREAEIAARLTAAAAAKTQADEREQNYRTLQQEAQARQDSLLAQALIDTEHEREALLNKTRQQLSREQQEVSRLLEQEKQAFIRRLEQDSAEALLSVSQKMIQDLADESLEEAIARQLLKQLQAALPKLQASLGDTRQGEVLSSFALSSSVQQRLQDELSAALPDLTLEFRAVARQPLGVSVQIGGVLLAWHLDAYVEDLKTLLAAPV